ncbi:MAG: outer membrane porin, OprD family [Campylobacterales bacterium]|nr:outer membrane porin, OprD family [Campylobacterales bacterium]
MKYIAKYIDIRIGRIKIDTPLIGADDGRAIPNLYEGVYLKSSYLENLSIESLFLNKMSGFWSQIHSQIEMGRFISMGKAAGYEGIADNSKVFALGVTYTKDNLSAKIWNYYSNELLNAYIVEGSITNNLFNSTLTTTLQYVSQEQIGDTKTYLNSLNRTLDYSYFGAKLELNYENLTTVLAMTNMDYQNKNWDNTMHIWAGLPQYTVAQEYGFKSANVNGADVYKAGLSYKFSQKNKIDLNYYKYDLSNKVSSNDTDVIDLIYNLKYSKNIDFTAVYERQEFKSNDSGDIAKVIANYSF